MKNVLLSLGRTVAAALLLLGAASQTAQAQSVGIGTTTPNSKAALEVSATDKGILIPRLTQAQRTALTSVPDGLMVFQTDGTTGFWYCFGGVWVNIPNANTAGDNLGNHTATQTLNLGTNKLAGSNTAGNGTGGLVLSSAGKLGVNSATAPVGYVDIQGGDSGSGTLGLTALSFQYGGLTGGVGLGGYRHFVRSRHNSTLSSNGNALDFYLNNSSALGGSSAVGTGNVQVLSLVNDNGSPRVGIGTTAPSEKLHVEAGSVYVNGESTGLILDAQGAKRVGLVKYASHEAGIWRTLDVNNVFEIGRVQGVTSLPGSPTGFLTDLAVDNNGYVGIGTAAPATTLHVAGTAGTPNVRLESLAGTGTRVVTTDASGNLSTTTTASLADNLGNHTATQNLALGNFSLTGTTNVNVGNNLNLGTNQLVGNGGSTGLSLSNSGRLGIGVTAPTARLHLQTTSGSLSDLDNDYVFEDFRNGGVRTQYMVQRAANGTAAAPAALGDGTTTGINIGGYGFSPYLSTGYAGFGYGETGMEGFYRGDGTTNLTELQLKTSSATRMTIGSSGSVGIGTTTPTALLDVNGTARVRSLTATGTRMVTADANGNLGNAALPTDTDAQTLSISGSTITISGSNSSVTVPSSADNLGNHTATTTLNLGTNKITGNGSTSGLGISSKGGLLVGDTNANVSVGTDTPTGLTTGYANVAVGASAGQLLTSGHSNVAVGRDAGRGLSSGQANTIVGAGAGYATSTALGNTLLGYKAGADNTAGDNTLVGSYAGQFTAAGGSNTFVGAQAGQTNVAGTNNTMLGKNANPSTSGLTNATAIGYQATVGASNSLVLGGTGTNAVNVGIGTTTPAATLEVGGATSTVRLGGLAGTGTRLVTTDASGNLGSTTTVAGESTTASNGLTLTGTTVQLGGTLTGSTTINLGLTGRTLAVAGTNGGQVTHFDYPASTSGLTIGTQMLAGFAGTSGSGGQVRFSGVGTGFVDIGQNSGGDFVVEGDNDMSRLVVQSTGNVGVGTTAPSALLDVAGSTRLRGLAGTGTRMVTTDASGNLSSATVPVDTDAQALSISGQTLSLTNGGSVTLPSVTGESTTATNGLTLSGTAVQLGGTLSAATTIANAGNNFNLTGTGNVGIGTTSPTEKLHINTGSLYVQGESQGVVVDEGGNKRAGLVKYAGKPTGLWRADGYAMAIGRVATTGSSLPGSPTAYYEDILLSNTGGVKMLSLAGTGTRMVTADASGNLSSATVPVDTDTDAQTLSISGQTLSLTNGGSVTLPSVTGESTTASNGLTLSGTAVQLGGTLGAATNVAQGGNVLSFTGGQVGIGTTNPANSNSRLHVLAGSATENALYAGISGSTSTANSLKLEHFGSNFIVRPATAGGIVTVVENSAGSLALNPSAGNVGIGTSSPAVKLEVAGTAGTSNVRLQSLGGTGTRMVTTDASGNLSSATVPVDTDAQQLSISGSTISLTSGGSVVVPSSADNLGNHSATQNVVLNSTYDLQLRGSTDFNHGLGWYGTGKLWNGTAIDGPALYGFTGGVLGTNNSGTKTTALGWTSGGNVGIGTLSPAVKLEVAGTAGTSNVRLQSLAGTGTRFVTADASGNLSTASGSAVESTTASNGLTLSGTDVQLGGTLSAATALATGGNNLSITGTGNVGIGTTAGSTAKLAVSYTGNDVATLQSSGTTGSWLGLQNTSTSGRRWNLISTGSSNGEGAGKLLVQDGSGGGVRATFDTGGNLGLGTTSPAVRLHVAGTSGTSNVRLESLAGTGTRMVTTDASGNLSSATVPTDTDTDAQQLSISGTTLSLTNGGSVTLPSSGSADNLGNHTATQKLDLGANALVGNGGTQGLTIGSAGQVGLGTTTPGGAFGQFGNTGANTIGADGQGGNLASGLGSLAWGLNATGYAGSFYNSNTSASGNGLAVKVNGTTATASVFDVSTGLQGNIGTSRLVVKAGGNVGINQVTPTSTLHVGGSSSTVRLEGLTGTGTRMVTAAADGTLATATVPVDTDAQTLSISGTTLSLTNGGSVTLPSGSADNLGNHTATQNLNLSTYKLTGNGSTFGLAVGSNGRLMTEGTNLMAGFRAGTNITNTTLPTAVTTVGNVMLGYYAGDVATSGFNTMVGGLAGTSVSSGGQNTLMGYNAGWVTTTGSGNVFVGASAGSSNTTGSNNTALGFGANVDAALSNATAIGFGASVTQSNSLVLGNGASVGIGLSAPTSTLHIVGSEALSYTDTGSSTSFTLGASHRTLRRFGTCTTVTIPAASTCAGRLYTIINSNGQGSFTLTVTGGGSVYDDITNTTFSGSNAFPAATRLTIQSDGTGWIVVSR